MRKFFFKTKTTLNNLSCEKSQFNRTVWKTPRNRNSTKQIKIRTCASQSLSLTLSEAELGFECLAGLVHEVDGDFVDVGSVLGSHLLLHLGRDLAVVCVCVGMRVS